MVEAFLTLHKPKKANSIHFKKKKTTILIKLCNTDPESPHVTMFTFICAFIFMPSFQTSTIFSKSPILEVLEGSEYTSASTKNICSCLLYILYLLWPGGSHARSLSCGIAVLASTR